MTKKFSAYLGGTIILASIVLAGFIVSHKVEWLTANADTSNCAANFKSNLVIVNYNNPTGNNVSTTATVKNISTDCTYTVGLASYKEYTVANFNDNINSQTLFNHTSTTIAPGQTQTMTVSLPSCDYQTDIFLGDPIVPPWFTDSNYILGNQTINGDVCKNTPSLTPPTVSAAAMCSASNVSTATVTWTNPNAGDSYHIDITDQSDFSKGGWWVGVPAGTTSYTVTDFSKFVPFGNVTSIPQFTPGKTYLVRILDIQNASTGSSVYSQNASFTTSTCVQQITGSCTANVSSANTGDTVTFNATATGGTGNFTYAWSGDENLSGSSQSVSKQYSSAGTKNAQVVITSGSQSITKNCSVTINQQAANLDGYCSANVSQVNTGDPVVWTAYPTGGTGNYTYAWSGTDGLSGSNQSETMRYYLMGQKYAQVTITSGSQSITRQCNLAQTNPQLAVSCSASASNVQAGSNVTYTANATGGNGTYTYSWSGDENLSGSNQTVNKIYNNSGNKNATITVTSNGQSATANCSTNVYQNIQNTLNGTCWVSNSNPNINDTVVWSASASGGTGNYTYTWNGSDGLSGNGSSVNRQYSYAGQKVGSVTITDGSQTVYKSCYTSVQQYQQNNLSASCSASQSSAYVGDNITWTANAYNGNGSYSYNWNGSDGLSSSNQNTSVTYNTPGQKTATVTVWSNGQSITQTCNVYISARSVVTLNNQPNPPTTGGVYLSQVPYTGIGSGTKVALFMVGLAVWSSAISYFLIRRKAKKEHKTVAQVLNGFNPTTTMNLAPAHAEIAQAVAVPAPSIDEVMTPVSYDAMVNALESHARTMRTVVSADGLKIIAQAAGNCVNDALGTLEQLVTRYEATRRTADEWTVLTTEKITRALFPEA